MTYTVIIFKLYFTTIVGCWWGSLAVLKYDCGGSSQNNCKVLMLQMNKVHIMDWEIMTTLNIYANSCSVLHEAVLASSSSCIIYIQVSQCMIKLNEYFFFQTDIFDNIWRQEVLHFLLIAHGIRLRFFMWNL